MNLTVQREPTFNGFTPGILSIDGVRECCTLEPPIREIPGQAVESWKVQNHTAIGVGRYRVVMAWSPHFGQDMPHVQGVDGFTCVMIHWGNFAKDTDACLLIGKSSTAWGIVDSRVEYDQFAPKLQAALLDGGEAWITYINPMEITT